MSRLYDSSLLSGFAGGLQQELKIMDAPVVRGAGSYAGILANPQVRCGKIYGGRTQSEAVGGNANPPALHPAEKRSLGIKPRSVSAAEIE